MTIFIVWFNNFHSQDEFSGAFSTLENAEAYIEKFDKFDQQSLRIEEYTLDS